ncbi:hypothetical protein EDB19DRAFT_871939 [Suillus lakei]|nr:hypothetical protein EDB19DRAFT_871939 [Suillus lakei]
MSRRTSDPTDRQLMANSAPCTGTISFIYLVPGALDEPLIAIRTHEYSDKEIVAGLRWNNNVSVVTITLICYEYLFLFEEEVKFVWKRQWSLMSYLYLIVSSALPRSFTTVHFLLIISCQVRYLGLFIALYVVVVASFTPCIFC